MSRAGRGPGFEGGQQPSRQASDKGGNAHTVRRKPTRGKPDIKVFLNLGNPVQREVGQDSSPNVTLLGGEDGELHEEHVQKPAGVDDDGVDYDKDEFERKLQEWLHLGPNDEYHSSAVKEKSSMAPEEESPNKIIADIARERGTEGAVEEAKESWGAVKKSSAFVAKLILGDIHDIVSADTKWGKIGTVALTLVRIGALMGMSLMNPSLALVASGIGLFSNIYKVYKEHKELKRTGAKLAGKAWLKLGGAFLAGTVLSIVNYGIVNPYLASSVAPSLGFGGTFAGSVLGRQGISKVFQLKDKDIRFSNEMILGAEDKQILARESAQRMLNAVALTGISFGGGVSEFLHPLAFLGGEHHAQPHHDDSPASGHDGAIVGKTSAPLSGEHGAGTPIPPEHGAGTAVPAGGHETGTPLPTGEHGAGTPIPPEHGAGTAVPASGHETGTPLPTGEHGAGTAVPPDHGAGTPPMPSGHGASTSAPSSIHEMGQIPSGHSIEGNQIVGVPLTHVDLQQHADNIRVDPHILSSADTMLKLAHEQGVPAGGVMIDHSGMLHLVNSDNKPIADLLQLNVGDQHAVVALPNLSNVSPGHSADLMDHINSLNQAMLHHSGVEVTPIHLPIGHDGINLAIVHTSHGDAVFQIDHTGGLTPMDSVHVQKLAEQVAKQQYSEAIQGTNFSDVVNHVHQQASNSAELHDHPLTMADGRVVHTQYADSAMHVAMTINPHVRDALTPALDVISQHAGHGHDWVVENLGTVLRHLQEQHPNANIHDLAGMAANHYTGAYHLSSDKEQLLRESIEKALVLSSGKHIPDAASVLHEMGVNHQLVNPEISPLHVSIPHHVEPSAGGTHSNPVGGNSDTNTVGGDVTGNSSLDNSNLPPITQQGHSLGAVHTNGVTGVVHGDQNSTSGSISTSTPASVSTQTPIPTQTPTPDSFVSDGSGSSLVEKVSEIIQNHPWRVGGTLGGVLLGLGGLWGYKRRKRPKKVKQRVPVADDEERPRGPEVKPEAEPEQPPAEEEGPRGPEVKPEAEPVQPSAEEEGPRGPKVEPEAGPEQPPVDEEEEANAGLNWDL